jgi:hypothetical protein
MSCLLPISAQSAAYLLATSLDDDEVSTPPRSSPLTAGSETSTSDSDETDEGDLEERVRSAVLGKRAAAEEGKEPSSPKKSGYVNEDFNKAQSPIKKARVTATPFPSPAKPDVTTNGDEHLLGAGTLHGADSVDMDVDSSPKKPSEPARSRRNSLASPEDSLNAPSVQRSAKAFQKLKF